MGDQVKAGQRAARVLARLILEKFYGSVTIKFESGKVTHVETETRRAWQHKDLPDSTEDALFAASKAKRA